MTTGFNISVLAIVVLLGLLLKLQLKNDHKNYIKSVLKLMLLVNAGMIFLEISEKWLGIQNRLILFSIGSLSLALTPLLFALWVCVVDYEMFGSEKRIRNRTYYLQILVVSCLITVANLLGGWIFDISLNCHYTCGDYVYLKYLMGGMPLVFVWYLFYKYRSRVTGELLLSTAIISLLFVTGVIFEMVLGYRMFWTILSSGSVAIRMLLNKEMVLDPYVLEEQ